MLTQRQSDVLNYINQYQYDHEGVSPSCAEINTALNCGSKGNVIRLLGCLEKRGFVRRLRYRARAIEIIRIPEHTSRPSRMVVFRFDDEAKELVELK